jgi:hypothetical protein
MGEVTVFAEDGVAGCLPGLCVRTGVPTDDQLAVRAQVNAGGTHLGKAWLLILLGPIGWVVLVVLALSRRPAGGLVIRVPYSAVARRKLQRTRRCEQASVVAVVALMVAEIVVLLTMPPSMMVISTVMMAGVAVAAVATVVSALLLIPMEVRARLDASRRWVTLSNIGPVFAFAAWEQSRSHVVSTLDTGDVEGWPAAS